MAKSKASESPPRSPIQTRAKKRKAIEDASSSYVAGQTAGFTDLPGELRNYIYGLIAIPIQTPHSEYDGLYEAAHLYSSEMESEILHLFNIHLDQIRHSWARDFAHIGLTVWRPARWRQMRHLTVTISWDTVYEESDFEILEALHLVSRLHLESLRIVFSPPGPTLAPLVSDPAHSMMHLYADTQRRFLNYLLDGVWFPMNVCSLIVEQDPNGVIFNPQRLYLDSTPWGTQREFPYPGGRYWIFERGNPVDDSDDEIFEDDGEDDGEDNESDDEVEAEEESDDEGTVLKSDSDEEMTDEDYRYTSGSDEYDSDY